MFPAIRPGSPEWSAMNRVEIQAAYRALSASLVKEYTSRLKSKSRAEDCLQEAVVRLLEVPVLLADAQAALRDEMKRTVNRSQHTARRDKKREIAILSQGEDTRPGYDYRNVRAASGEVLVSKSPSPLENAEGLLLYERLSATLKGWRKEVFELGVVQKLPLSVVAYKTGSTLPATRMRVSRLRRELRKRVARKYLET